MKTITFKKLARKFIILSVSCILLVTNNTYAQTSGEPTALKCEHLNSPLGIDNPNPRFTWRLTDPSKGAKQLAYCLLVSDDSLNIDKGNIWNSGKIISSDNIAVYKGTTALNPFTKYFWKVIVWNKDGVKSNGKSYGSFEMGMMNRSNWNGYWISDNNGITVKSAAYFRKEFVVTKKVKTARAYIAVAGLYELSINGEKNGDHFLDPMYTRFDRRTLYVTHDVTKDIQTGKNAIGIQLGNGWYNHQSTAVWDFHKAPWRNRPAFCFDLRITYVDGSTEIIKSDRDWKTSLSPVIFNSIYTAEHYDARLEQPGWDKANFDDSKWANATYRTAPSTNIVAQAMHPVRHVETLKAVSVKKFNDTTYVFDMGRNIAGVSSITVNGAEGTVVKLRHAERLHDNGHVDQSNIDVHYRPTDDTDPFQTDIYILNGKGAETFMPRFNYKGFQYVEVTSSRPVQLGKESVQAYFMHSDVPSCGNISSSNEVINKIWWATNNSYLSNLFGYPTDCPQREKNGWTGDAHIAVETGLYNFDGITVYEKWMADHRDEQQPNGVLPAIIPTDGWGYDWGNCPDWTSTIAIIPWNLDLFYNDKKILSDCYDNMKSYVDHITDISPAGLTTWGLGDWVPVKSKAPVELTSTAYYYADAVILAKTAKLLGKENDYKTYDALAKKIKNAFNKKYLDINTGIYGSGTQTEMSAPLHWGLVDDNMKKKVAANLAKRVADDNYHLDVGLLGTKTILNALSENGYADVAYKIAAQKDYPSWGWWMVNGATTLYENWPIDAKSDISMNHIMFGEIGAWLYKGLGGIFPDENNAGFKNVLLCPNFVKDLDSFSASHEAPTGIIVSSWKKSGNSIFYKVIIPPNSTATLSLELAVGKQLYENGNKVSDKGSFIKYTGKDVYNRSLYSLQSGTYDLEIK